jgi:hypothetical protein
VNLEYVDGDSRAGAPLNLSAYPAYLLLGPRGASASHAGPRDGPALRAFLARALNGAPFLPAPPPRGAG